LDLKQQEHFSPNFMPHELFRSADLSCQMIYLFVFLLNFI
jgi:hypothetical protein